MRLEPFDLTYSRDPASTWRRILATRQTVGFDPELRLWLIAGHDTVRAVLSDTDRFANAASLFPITAVSPQVGAVLAGFDAPHVAATADGAQHHRTRAILRALFPTTAERVQHRWGELIARRAGQLVDDLADDVEIDLTQFAVQLPLQIILEVLGLPDDNADAVRDWTDSFAALVWGNPSPDTQLAAARDCVALWNYCTQIVTDRASTADHGAGLIGDLLRYRNGDDTRLTVPEAAAFALNIAGAGWETTAGAIGHALEHALCEPGRWTRLAHDEHYLATHIEETLRHSPVIDGWLRLTTTDVTIGGVTIPAGSRCLILIGTANHDARIYPESHVFDPGRARLSQHLAFGAGAHYCIGAALARAELTIALRTLARRRPHLTLVTSHQRRFKANAALRQHVTLPATTSTAARCPVAHAVPAGVRR
jgi:cytochrome P450